jgi:hypothetical protein
MESEANQKLKAKELLVALLPRTSALDILKTEGGGEKSAPQIEDQCHRRDQQ